MEYVSSAASSATQTATETLATLQDKGNENPDSSPSKDPQDSSSRKSYKQQLDEAAYPNVPSEEREKTGSLVEKGGC